LWEARFQNYPIDAEIRRNQRLHNFVDDEGFIIYSTLRIEQDPKNKLIVLLDKFEGHFKGKENISYGGYEFFSNRQKLVDKNPKPIS
ncbi:hypothetical protein HHI36_010340, partial [Cryptolaemus montrouzieri]